MMRKIGLNTFTGILFCLVGNAMAQEFQYMDLGWQCAQRNQLDSALFYYDLSLKAYPAEPVAYKFRGMAFHQKGNFKKAITDFNLALKAKVDSFDVLRERGKSYMELAKYDSAIHDLNYLIARTSEARPKARLINTKAYCYLQKWEFAEAEVCVNNAKLLDSLDFFSILCQTILYTKTNRAEKALTNSFRLMEYYPEYFEGYFLCGLSYGLQQNARESIRYLKKAMNLSSGNASIYSEVSLVYSILYKFDSALLFAEKAIALNNKLSNAYLAKGFALWGLRDYAPSVDALNQALQLEPGLVLSYEFRGKAYFGLKKYALAEKDFKQAIKLNKQNAESFLFLGYIYKDQGKKTEACLHWKKAIDLGASDIKDEMDRYCK